MRVSSPRYPSGRVLASSAGGPRFKDFLLDKTMAYTCVVNNCSNGPYWLKNWEKLLVNMDAFIPTTNVAVTPFQANTRI